MSQDLPGENPETSNQGAPMDSILAQWRRERPDIDSSPMAVCGDLWRAAERARRGVVANVAVYDLDLAGLDVLLTLRRQGPEGSLSPSAMAKEMMLSTSAMTNRLDRLEKRGLIQRRTDPGDRRGLRVVLTDAGSGLADEIVESHVKTEERLLTALSRDERDLLRTLLNRIG